VSDLIARFTVTDFKNDQDSSAALDRRRFLSRSAAAATICACGAAALGCGTTNANARAVIGKSAGEGRVRIGQASRLANVGQQLKVTVQGLESPVLVARVSDGELKAISITCSHYGSELALVDGERKFRCTDHGSEFDLGGRAVKGPAKDSLETYPVVEEDGKLYLVLGG